MKYRSKLLEQFINEIKHVNRNPKDTAVLRLLDDKLTNPNLPYVNGDLIYRCRICASNMEINEDSDFYGYNEKDSFVPPPEKTKDMRANYKGIPYLYCANDPYISIVECRPRLGSRVSVATIEVVEPLHLFDTTIQYWPVKLMDDGEKYDLILDLSAMFSEPLAHTDDTSDYIPTQYIAEYIKNLGYDGIVYQSSLTPEINEKCQLRYNIVLFNYNKCKAIKSNVYEITYNWIKTRKIDSSSDAPVIREPEFV